MRGQCERCGRGLAPDDDGALICSFECTFCRSCGEGELAFRCPNCAGELRERPMRVGDALRRHPPEAHDRAVSRFASE